MMSNIYSVGDSIELIRSNHGDPPIGSIGLITKLYEAFGGPAAQITWDDKPPKGVRWGNRVLLENVKLVDPPEIDESDISLDILFGGVAI